MKKKHIRVIVLFTALIILPLLALFLISKMQQGPLRRELTDLIKRNVKEQVKFDDFSLSYFRDFPKLHLQIKNVSVSSEGQTSIRIGSVELLLNPAGLLRNEIRLDKLILSDAALYSKIDSLGHKTHILTLKENPEGDSYHKFNINSHDIEVHKANLSFINQFKGSNIKVNVDDARLNLEMKDSLLLISGVIQGCLDTLISYNKLLISGQAMKAVDMTYSINTLNGLNEIRSGYLMAQELKIDPSLRITPIEDGYDINFRLSAEDNFDKFLKLFKFHAGMNFTQANPGAKLDLSMDLSGFVNPRIHPLMNLNFSLINAEIINKDIPYPIIISTLKGKYTNGDKHCLKSTSISLDTIHAELSQSYVDGSISVFNLDDPDVNAHIISSIDLSHFSKVSADLSLSGRLDLDLTLEGKLSELRKIHKKGEEIARGRIEVHNLQLIRTDQAYHLNNINGKSLLKDHILEITSLRGAFNESAFHFQGKFDKLDEFIMDRKKVPGGEIELDFDKIDLRKIKFSSQKTPDTAKVFSFPFPIGKIEFKLKGKKILTDQGIIENLLMKGNLSPSKLKISSAGFRFQDGVLDASGEVAYGNNGIMYANANVRGDFQYLRLDIPEKKVPSENPFFSIPAWLNAQIDLHVAKGKLQNIDYTNMDLATEINGLEIKIKKLGLNSFNGRAELSGLLSFKEKGPVKAVLDGSMVFNHLDLDEIQRVFTAKHPENPKAEKAKLPPDLNLHIDIRANEMTYKDVLLSDFSTKLLADSHSFQIEALNAGLPFGKIDMDLQAGHLFSDSLYFSGNANINIDTLVLENVMRYKLFEGNIEKKSEPAGFMNELSPVEILSRAGTNLNIQVHANHISYMDSAYDSLNLKLHFIPEKVWLEELRFNLPEGIARLQAYLLLNQGKEAFPGFLSMEANNIEISDFLRSFGNFDQDVFTSENTSGKLSWNLDYYFKLGPDFIPIRDQNAMMLNMRIKHAELNNVEPLEHALFFIGHKTKDNFLISELTLSAYLFKENFYFKDLYMNDNIARLEIFGKYDHPLTDMSLGMAVSLSDLFFRSKGNRILETEEGIVKVGKDARVFLKLKGPLKGYKISLSSGKKFNDFREQMLEELFRAQQEFKNRDTLKTNNSKIRQD